MGPKQRVLKWILALLVGTLAASWLYSLFVFGESGFHTTVLIYVMLGGVFFLSFRALRWNNLLLSILSMLAVLLMAEAFLRFVRKDPITYSEMNGQGYASMYKADVSNNYDVITLGGRSDALTLHYPANYSVPMASVDFEFENCTTNELGLRGSLPKQGTSVVLTLGDSFTEGAGAPCDSSYPELLGGLLMMMNSPLHIINGGVSGNDPFFDFQMLQKLQANYQPEQVIFLVNTTDINDVMMRGGLERFLPSGRLNYRDAPWWEPIYAVSFVSRLFFHGIVGVGMDLLKAEEKQAYRIEALSQIRDLFKNHVAAFAKKNGIKVSVVTMPLRYEMQSASEDYTYLIGALSGIPDIEFIDCRPMLMAHADIDGLYWPRDGHFQPVGYARLAECVYHHVFISSDTTSVHGN